MMEMNRLLTGIYNLCQAITHYFFVNLLWIAGIVAGGVVFGLMPSTVAMYTVARKSIMGEKEFPLLKTFWRAYREAFFRANGLGLILSAILFIWFIDLHFFRSFEGILFSALNLLMIVVGVVILVMLLYLFPVYVHYDLKLFQYLKYAIYVAFLQPGNLMLMLACLTSSYFFFVYVPGLIPMFGAVLMAQINMWIAFKGFQHIESIHSKSVNSKVKGRRLFA